MNLRYLATLLSLASSASEAKNLRFEKPERLLGGLKKSHNQNNNHAETSVETQVRILKSSNDWVDTINAICILPEECEDVDEDDLEKMAKDALKSFNSDDYSSCSDDECPGDNKWCCYNKSGDNENFGTVLHTSCNSKKVEKDLEDEMISALSGSNKSNKSKKSKRVRMLRRLKSGLSSSPDEANFNMACIRESQVNTRACAGEDVDLDEVANQLANKLKSGSSFDIDNRRLKGGNGKANVVLANIPSAMLTGRCYRKGTVDDDEFDEEELVDALAEELKDAWNN